MNLSEMFWSSSIEELMKGYAYMEGKEQYVCLVCGKVYEKGVIYQENGNLMEAEKAAKSHVAEVHEGMFEYLLGMNKKYTGLTEHQQNLLGYFRKGFSDKEIVQQLGGGSTSTIRNHRFNFKEREKQAKIYLAIMGLLDKSEEGTNKLVNAHRGATMIDERYATTEKERDEVIKRYFYLNENNEEKLIELPAKQKRKLIVLQHLMGKIDPERSYTEKEISKLLEGIFYDYVTIRRYLIEYGFMDRAKDGSSYWVKK